MKFLRSLTAFSLAITLLVSGMGLTLNMHLCGGEVQSVAFFHQAEPCPMQQDCHGKTVKKSMSGCCEEKSVEIKGKVTQAEVQQVVVPVAQLQPQAFVLPVLFALPDVQAPQAIRPVTYTPPPLPAEDIALLTRTFLI